jgi:hypothetical protein
MEKRLKHTDVGTFESVCQHEDFRQGESCTPSSGLLKKLAKIVERAMMFSTEKEGANDVKVKARGTIVVPAGAEEPELLTEFIDKHHREIEEALARKREEEVAKRLSA